MTKSEREDIERRIKDLEWRIKACQSMGQGGMAKGMEKVLKHLQKKLNPPKVQKHRKGSLGALFQDLGIKPVKKRQRRRSI